MFVSNQRFQDYLRAQMARDHTAEKDHDAFREQIKELSEQTRGEFDRIRDEVNRRHNENRRTLWSIALVIIGAYVAAYFAQHGLSMPGFH